MKKKFLLWRGNLYLLQQFSFVFAVICVVILFLNSFMTFEYVSGNQVYSNMYFINPFDSSGDFGESDVFNELLDRSIEDITRLAVIKSQLETDGEFNGKKIIDVAKFSHRKSPLAGKEGTVYLYSANYYLENLIKWGRYEVNYIETHYDSMWKAVSHFNQDVLEDYYYVLELYEDEAFHLSYDGNLYYYIDSDGKYIPVYEGAGSGCTAAVPTMKTIQEETTEETSVPAQENEAQETKTNPILENAPSIMDTLVSTAFYYEISVNASDYSEVLKTPGGVPEAVVNLLNERYETVGGSTLRHLAGSWKEYFSLCSSLVSSMESLAYNYNQYQAYRDEYDHSNLKFCLSMTIDGKQVLYGNDNKLLSNPSTDKDEYFRNNYDRYIIFCPGEMLYATNTDISEQRIFSEMNNYPYAYSENSRMWIGINTQSYVAGDKFAKAATVFDGFMPRAWLYATQALVGFLGWFASLVYLCLVTGKKSNEDGTVSTRVYWFDKMPTEIELALAGGLGAAYIFGVYINLEIVSSIFTEIVEKKPVGIYVNAAVQALILSLLFTVFIYSFIRRFKAKNIWKNSIARTISSKTWQAVKFIFRKSKGFILLVYDNGRAVTRIVMPFLMLIVLNAIAGMFFYRYLYAGLDYRNYFFSFSVRAVLVSLFLLLIVAVDVGALLVLLWSQMQRNKIIEGIHQICEGDMSYKINMETMHGENKVLAKAVNNIGDSMRGAVETSMKDERLKADLITNVSHDIKTPLTSIINYVDLLKREHVETEPIKGYIEVLDAKSQRLKQLTDDLVEASKISSGNITLIMDRINLTELLNQAVGEFEEKFAQKGLQMLSGYDKTPVCIMADSRRIWRVMENLLNNVYKYAMEHTRIYLDMTVNAESVMVSIKNISAQPLNIQADELTERFIRGDVSRSTEGSGLGLAIAKNLTVAQGGEFNIYLDGDLFKVNLTFPIAQDKKEEDEAE